MLKLTNRWKSDVWNQSALTVLLVMMDAVGFEFHHRPHSSKFLLIFSLSLFFASFIVLVYTMYILPTVPSTSTFFYDSFCI